MHNVYIYKYYKMNNIYYIYILYNIDIYIYYKYEI